MEKHKSSGMCKIIILTIIITISSSYNLAEVVKFDDLSRTRLSSNESITITGEFPEMELIDVSLTYTVTGFGPKTVSGKIVGNTWQVTLDPLQKNTQVLYNFHFRGKLKENYVISRIDKILGDPEFESALSEFAESSQKKTQDEQAVFAEKFRRDLAAILAKYLPKNLKASLEETFDLEISYFTNLRENIKYMKANEVSNIKPEMLPFAASKELEKMDKEKRDNLSDEAKESIYQFTKNYLALKNVLLKEIKTEVTVQSQQEKTAFVKDFEKVIGLDIAAVYMPGLNELRQFFSLHIYYGTVEDTPAPASKEMARGQRFWSYLQQRISLALGVSGSDISGNDQSVIKENNAFLFGLGYRINKYFRLSAGCVFYRAVETNDLELSYFFGASMDFSTFLNNVIDVFAKK